MSSVHLYSGRSNDSLCEPKQRVHRVTIGQPICRTVAEIERKIIKQGGRHAISRLFHAKNDKETIAGWKLDLNRILHIFNVCSVSPARWSLIAPV